MRFHQPVGVIQQNNFFVNNNTNNSNINNINNGNHQESPRSISDIRTNNQLSRVNVTTNETIFDCHGNESNDNLTENVATRNCLNNLHAIIKNTTTNNTNNTNNFDNFNNSTISGNTTSGTTVFGNIVKNKNESKYFNNYFGNQQTTNNSNSNSNINQHNNNNNDNENSTLLVGTLDLTEENLTKRNYPRGIINPNYPGFQHLAHTLAEHFVDHHHFEPSSDSDLSEDFDFDIAFRVRNLDNVNIMNDNNNNDNINIHNNTNAMEFDKNIDLNRNKNRRRSIQMIENVNDFDEKEKLVLKETMQEEDNEDNSKLPTPDILIEHNKKLQNGNFNENVVTMVECLAKECDSDNRNCASVETIDEQRDFQPDLIKNITETINTNGCDETVVDVTEEEDEEYEEDEEEKETKVEKEDVEDKIQNDCENELMAALEHVIANNSLKMNNVNDEKIINQIMDSNSPKKCSNNANFSSMEIAFKLNSSADTDNYIFDVYNIETALPVIDLEAIETHLMAAKEEEQKRKNDREAIRRRLAMGEEDDYFTNLAAVRPIRKPNLQSRMQNGKNLQICFMNEAASDTESSDSETCPKLSQGDSYKNRKKSLRKQKINSFMNSRSSINNNPYSSRPLSMAKSVLDHIGSERKGKSLNEEIKEVEKFNYIFQFAERPTTLSLGPPLSDNNFFTHQARLQIEARMALAQAKDMAHMQMEMERQKQRMSPITELVHKTLDKVGMKIPEDKRRMSRQMLTVMNVAQLQIIVNELHTYIETLNEALVKYLMDRDDLHMKQDSMLIDIEDITRYLVEKEEAITTSTATTTTSTLTTTINGNNNKISQSQQLRHIDPKTALAKRTTRISPSTSITSLSSKKSLVVNGNGGGAVITSISKERNEQQRLHL
ncbi:unnamed protein product [Diamesa serratosioi]